MASSQIRAFDDPGAYMAAIRAAEVEVLPTRAGNFSAELMQMNLRRLWLQRGSESLPGISQTTIRAERMVLGFLADSDQPAIRHCGAELTPREILLCDWQSTHRRSEAPCRWASMSLAPEDFAATFSMLVGRELGPLTTWRLLRPQPAAMSCLVELHRKTAHVARHTPLQAVHPEVVRALEHVLVHAMVACLADGLPVEIGRGTRRRSAVIERLETFLAAHHGDPVYLAELCAAVGVSERTLRIFCHEQFGMGPIRFLWLRRMHNARRALAQAAMEAATVTEIATEQGFWELGRFSVEYHALFGESPSATLRQPAAIAREAA
jgi:AraC-like DNA-binding protein